MLGAEPLDKFLPVTRNAAGAASHFYRAHPAPPQIPWQIDALQDHVRKDIGLPSHSNHHRSPTWNVPSIQIKRHKPAARVLVPASRPPGTALAFTR